MKKETKTIIILAIIIGLAFFLSFYHPLPSDPETKEVNFSIGDVGWCITKQYRDFAIQHKPTDALIFGCYPLKVTEINNIYWGIITEKAIIGETTYPQGIQAGCSKDKFYESKNSCEAINKKTQ